MSVFIPLSEALLIAACIAAAAGCFLLNRRMRRLQSTEEGIGKAVADMSRSASQFEETLARAESSARGASETLDARIDQAEALLQRLEAIVLAGAGAPSARNLPSGTRSGRGAASDPLADIVPKGFAASGAGKKGPGAARSGAAAGASEHPLAALSASENAVRPRRISSLNGQAQP
ncbi:MAG: DUF6468 domain-containing protein [Geminicoccaceae bacterium]